MTFQPHNNDKSGSLTASKRIWLLWDPNLPVTSTISRLMVLICAAVASGLISICIVKSLPMATVPVVEELKHATTAPPGRVTTIAARCIEVAHRVLKLTLPTNVVAMPRRYQASPAFFTLATGAPTIAISNDLASEDWTDDVLMAVVAHEIAHQHQAERDGLQSFVALNSPAIAFILIAFVAMSSMVSSLWRLGLASAVVVAISAWLLHVGHNLRDARGPMFVMSVAVLMGLLLVALISSCRSRTHRAHAAVLCVVLWFPVVAIASSSKVRVAEWEADDLAMKILSSVGHTESMFRMFCLLESKSPSTLDLDHGSNDTRLKRLGFQDGISGCLHSSTPQPRQ